MRKLIEIGLLVVSLPLLMGAEVYRWTDPNGVVNFTQLKPRGVQAEHITTGAGGPMVIAEATDQLAGMAGGGEADPKAAACAARAGLASRTNTLFSIPMLFFMAAASHNPSLTASLDMGGGQLGLYWIIALVVIAVFEAGALMGPGLPTQKPLASVKGTIHAGFAVTIVVFALQYCLLG